MKESRWLLIPMLVAMAAWLPGIDWGLPTRQTDAALFGQRAPWTGAELLSLLPAEDPEASRGADVDATPIASSARPVLLNGSDPDRAVIVRRYRLQSRQPDEFINFKAIADMARRGDFDPRLYQYGGLWLYPLAAALKAASIVGLIQLRPDMAFYLDHPDAFGRFYVTARLFSVAWGLLGVFAVCWIVRGLTDRRLLAALAGIGFAMLPIVVNAAHEAKPHLAGTALMLLSVVPATRFVERGYWRDAVLAGLTCGAAAAMVVSAVLGLIILPVMAMLRRDEARRRLLALLLSLACASTLYAATNPFVLYNLAARPELLGSNLGNSTAMYSIGFAGLGRAITLLDAGGTIVLLVMAVVGLIGLSFRPRGRACRSSSDDTADSLVRSATDGGHPTARNASDHAVFLLLSAPSLLVLAQFILLAHGKPTEYARFALLPLSWMLVVSVIGLHRVLPQDAWSHLLSALLVGYIAVLGGLQTAEFVRERTSSPPDDVAPLSKQAAATVALAYEPAPWSCPPVDLFRHAIMLLPDRQLPDDPRSAGFDLAIAPGNLASQVGATRRLESFNWASNRWIIRGWTTSRPGNGP